mmetsp:Transcript_31266/g.60399  ORF Transcript_31266/g.60399 Transcript_31266/m.60399 type:complete len:256 (-) Transcript_31266:852-1619(-)
MYRREAVIALHMARQAFLRGVPANRSLWGDGVGINWCQLAGKRGGGCHEYPRFHLSWICRWVPLICANQTKSHHAWAAMSSRALHCHGGIIGYQDHVWRHPGSSLHVRFDSLSGSCAITATTGKPASLAPCRQGQLLSLMVLALALVVVLVLLLLLLLLPVDSMSRWGREDTLCTMVANGRSTLGAESCSTASRAALELAVEMSCVCLCEEWLLLLRAVGAWLGDLTSRTFEMFWRVFAPWQRCLRRHRCQDGHR